MQAHFDSQPLTIFILKFFNDQELDFSFRKINSNRLLNILILNKFLYTNKVTFLKPLIGFYSNRVNI
jgi:hypothetical protein